MNKWQKKKKAEDGISILSDAGRKPDPGLLGQKWIQHYGENIDYLHFHNYLEIGYCYGGDGFMVLGEEESASNGGIVTVIPPNYPHTTNSDIGTVSKVGIPFHRCRRFYEKIPG